MTLILRWALVSHNAAGYNSFVHVGTYTSCDSVSGKRDHRDFFFW
jgi:hypothetical protein